MSIGYDFHCAFVAPPQTVMRAWMLTPEVPLNNEPGMSGILEVRTTNLFHPRYLYVSPDVQVLEIKFGDQVQPRFEQYQRPGETEIYVVDRLFDSCAPGITIAFDLLFLRKTETAVSMVGTAAVPA